MSAAAAAAAASAWQIARPGCAPSKPASERTKLGEGPLWCDRAQCLYFVDIEGARVHRHVPATATAAPQNSSVEFGSMVGCLALTSRVHQLLLAADSGLWLLDWSSGASWKLAPFPLDPAAFRWNDGRVSPAGTLLVGSLYRDEEHGEGKGALFEYALAADGTFRCARLLDQLSISNGLDWTRDAAKLYFIDTPTAQVDVFDYDAARSGTHLLGPDSVAAPAPAPAAANPLSNRTKAFAVPKEHSWPDGMCMDAEGQLWIAHWDGARVTRFSVTGEHLSTRALPTGQTTCPCFGGPELRDLYVTSASRDVDTAKEPTAGSLFVLKGAGQGRPAHVLKGDIKLDHIQPVQHQIVHEPAEQQSTVSS